VNPFESILNVATLLVMLTVAGLALFYHPPSPAPTPPAQSERSDGLTGELSRALIGEISKASGGAYICDSAYMRSPKIIDGPGKVTLLIDCVRAGAGNVLLAVHYHKGDFGPTVEKANDLPALAPINP